MLRRLRFPQTRLQHSAATTAAIIMSSSSATSVRFASSTNNSSGSSSSVLDEHIDPNMRNLFRFLANDKNQPELVVVVDATALFFRLLFRFRTTLTSSAKAKTPGDGRNDGLESDPTLFIQQTLPKFLQFAHTVVPIGDGGKYQPPILPHDVAKEALEAGFLEPSGGPYGSTAASVTFLKNQRHESEGAQRHLEATMTKQEQENHDILKRLLEKGSDSNSNNSSKNGPSMLVGESATSPGLVKRRVILCFDHGRDYTRTKWLPAYKGQRPHCGRFASFVGYASALARQLHASGMVQAVLPLEMPAVLLDAHAPLPKTPNDFVKKMEKAQHDERDLKLLEDAAKQHLAEQIAAKKQNSKKNNDNTDEAAASLLRKGMTTSRASMLPDSFLESLLTASTSGSPLNTTTAAEADDIVATCARYYSDPTNPRNKNRHVLVISHDKDLLQLLENPRSHYFHLGQHKLITRSEACQHYGISSPKYLADYLTLFGDVVDNVEGVRGVGAKRCKLLMQNYGSLENLIAAAKKGDAVADTYAPRPNKALIASVRKANPEAKTEAEIEALVHQKLEYLRQRRAKSPGAVDVRLFPEISKTAAHLRMLRDNIIALHELDDVRNFLQQADEEEETVAATSTAGGKQQQQQKRRNNTNSSTTPVSTALLATDSSQQQQLPKTCSFMNPPILCSSIERHLFTTASFRRINSRPMPHQIERTPFNVWREIRNFYVKSHGPCTVLDEPVHHCGSLLLTSFERKVKYREEREKRAALKAKEKSLRQADRAKNKKQNKKQTKKNIKKKSGSSNEQHQKQQTGAAASAGSDVADKKRRKLRNKKNKRNAKRRKLLLNRVRQLKQRALQKRKAEAQNKA